MRPQNNFYPQDFQEQQRQQSYLNDRRNGQPLNDGFSISDGSQGTVVAVDGQSRADYDKMIKSNYKYTQDNYQEAYKEAARTGKPIVAIIGGFEHNNSRQLIENSLPDAKSGAAKDAVYIYIDREKTKDPALVKFADSQLAGGHNAAVSLVFTVKPGEGGPIQPEEPSFRWQGADRSMISSFNQAIASSREKQESYTGKFEASTFLEKSVEQAHSSRGSAIEGTRSLITREISLAHNATDWHEAELHFHEAMDAADKISPQQIQKEQLRIADSLAATKQDSPEFQHLVQDQGNLTWVKNAKAMTRASLGTACLEWSENQSPEGRKQQFREIGAKWIESAALRKPSLYQNQELLRDIADTRVPADEIRKLLPKLGPVPLSSDPYQFGGSRKQSDAPPSMVTPYEADVPPPPTPYEAEVSPSSQLSLRETGASPIKGKSDFFQKRKDQKR